MDDFTKTRKFPMLKEFEERIKNQDYSFDDAKTYFSVLKIFKELAEKLEEQEKRIVKLERANIPLWGF